MLMTIFKISGNGEFYFHHLTETVIIYKIYLALRMERPRIHMDITLIFGIVLIIAIIIAIVGFIKKIRVLKYIGIIGASIWILLIILFIVLLSFSNM